MGIPTLKESQVKTLTDMCTQFGAFSQVTPEEALDGTELYESAMEEIRDTEQLQILGLINDISEDQKESVGKLFSITGRMHKIYRITEVGRKMFEAPDRTPN